VSQCVVAEPGLDCPRAKSCPVRPFWEHLSSVLTDGVGSITLQDICDSMPAACARKVGSDKTTRP